MKKLIACAVSIGLGLLAAPAVLAQSASESWTLDCDSANCSTTRGLRDSATDRLAATFIALVEKDQPELRLGLALPLGTALRPGILFLVGEDTIEIPFEVCFPDGCRALRPITVEEEAMLSTSETVEIRFFPFSLDKPVSMLMPLGGFAEIIADARAQLGG